MKLINLLLIIFITFILFYYAIIPMYKEYRNVCQENVNKYNNLNQSLSVNQKIGLSSCSFAFTNHNLKENPK